MAEASRHDEQMPDGVMMAQTFPHKENDSDRISQTARDDQQNRYQTQRREQRFDRDNTDPTHHEIRNNRHSGKFLTEKHSAENPDSGKYPDKNKQILPDAGAQRTRLELERKLDNSQRLPIL